MHFSGGSNYNTTYDQRDFPAVPYNDSNFTPRENCPSESGGIEDYQDPNQVRNCYLVGELKPHVYTPFIHWLF